jgi:uncharacterized protein (DUF433 family)
MIATTNKDTLIVETPRGPSIAGTRITVYSVMDLIKADWSRERILQFMPITARQLDAVYAYIEQHREEVERDYDRILRRSEELRARYKKIQLERSPFPPDLPAEEKRRLMLQRIAEMNQAAQSNNDHHDPSRP